MEWGEVRDRLLADTMAPPATIADIICRLDRSACRFEAKHGLKVRLGTSRLPLSISEWEVVPSRALGAALPAAKAHSPPSGQAGDDAYATPSYEAPEVLCMLPESVAVEPKHQDPR